MIYRGRCASGTGIFWGKLSEHLSGKHFSSPVQPYTDRMLLIILLLWKLKVTSAFTEAEGKGRIVDAVGLQGGHPSSGFLYSYAQAESSVIAKYYGDLNLSLPKIVRVTPCFYFAQGRHFKMTQILALLWRIGETAHNYISWLFTMR